MNFDKYYANTLKLTKSSVDLSTFAVQYNYLNTDIYENT